MNLREWYGSSVRIPKSFNRQAYIFAVSSVHLVEIAMNLDNADYHIQFHDGDNCYVDKATRKIWISSLLLSPDLSKRINPKASVEESISTMLGLVFHEGLHVPHSFSDNLEAFHYSRMKSVTKPNKFVFLFFNLLEDYYIDYFAFTNHNMFWWMFTSAYEYYFPIESMESFVEPIVTDGKITTAESAKLFLHAAVLYKNPSLRNLIIEKAPDLEPLLLKCYKAIEYRDKFERVKYIGATFDEIFQLPESEQAELNDVSDVEAIVALILDMGTDGKSITTQQNSELSRLMNSIVSRIDSNQITSVDFVDHEVFHITPKASKTSNEIKIDDVFLQLEQLSRALANKIKPKGIRAKRGYRLSDPSRIATDGRIFRDPVDSKALLPYEIILFVDCSGSMMGGDKLPRAFGAAIGAAYGLEAGRHKVTILGHTADVGDMFGGCGLSSGGPKQNVILYIVKRSHESLSLALDRSNGIISNYPTSQNRDGEAIFAASNCFKESKHRRAIIVISDGCPVADMYSGDYAVKDTKKYVEKVRALGITVLSLSIEQSAVESNDEIYGRENNTYSKDPSVIEKILAMLLQNGAR
jgi:hypothetical protein